MTKSVEKIYSEAEQDQEFHTSLKEIQEKDYKPASNWTNDQKCTYALIYYGWKVGKNDFNRVEYEN